MGEFDSSAQYAMKNCLKKGADEVVVSVTTGRSRQIKFVNNEIAATNAWTDQSMGIMVVKDKKIAFTNTRDLTQSSIEKNINEVFDIVKVAQPNPLHMGLAEGPFKYKKINDLYDPRIENLETRSIDLLEASINKALEQGAKRCSGVFEFGASESLLLTSHSVEATNKSSAANFSLRALVDEKSSGHSTCCSRTLKGFDPVSAAKEASSIAKMSINPQKLAGGKMQVLFSPLPFSNFLNSVISAASINSVETGSSFFVNQLNKQVADKKVTLWDDGELSGGMATSPFDDEGVPTQRTLVIKDGVLKTYLHNTSTAKRYKTRTTANAGIISPDPTNCVMKPGKDSFEKLIAGIDKGLWITNLWYTRFQNYMTGEFSTIPRDGIFFIKNGEIAYPVKDLRVSDNMLSIMRNISAIGKDLRQIIGWDSSIPTFTPSVVIDSVGITQSKFNPQAVS